MIEGLGADVQSREIGKNSKSKTMGITWLRVVEYDGSIRRIILGTPSIWTVGVWL